MKLELTPLSPDRILIAFTDANLDAGNVKAFREAMQAVTERNRAVMIDMSQLTFVDSSGLGALLSCLRTMKNKDGQLALFGLTKPVKALFELVRMHRLFPIYDNLDQAGMAA